MLDHNLGSLFTHQVKQVRLDPAELRAKVAGADVALLLLSLVHVAGDTRPLLLIECPCR
jgi:hypothetical protein